MQKSIFSLGIALLCFVQISWAQSYVVSGIEKTDKEGMQYEVLVDALSIKVAKLCNLEVLDNGGTPPMAIVITGSSDKTLEQAIS